MRTGLLAAPIPRSARQRTARRGLRVARQRAPRARAQTAAAWASAQVEAVADDPLARCRLLERTYHDPVADMAGRPLARASASRSAVAPMLGHLPFARAALSFMRWQVQRGLLQPLDATPPGSDWWRRVNERLLRDGCEAQALARGLAGYPPSRAVRFWLMFIATPSARSWYRAHNASIVHGYIEHRELAGSESEPERFFMNVVLARVLYAHALIAAPRLALGRCAPLGRLLGDPRLGMAGAFLSLGRVLPSRYPLAHDIATYIEGEHHIGRMLDYAVIAPRLEQLYEWAAAELREPAVLELVRDGHPAYAWPLANPDLWQAAHIPRSARVLHRATRPA